jgi:hypothetical protein
VNQSFNCHIEEHGAGKGRKVSYMAVNGNGLPWDRTPEEGAQERVQWLHPRDGNRLRKRKAPNICANSRLRRVG